jgi:hypothetical protein
MVPSPGTDGSEGKGGVEGTNADKIVITPIADTYARMTAPWKPDGANTIVKVSGPTNTGDITYIKFDLTGLAGKNITNAKLRMYVTNASTGTQAIYQVDNNSWSESNLNYKNKPALGSLITSFKSNNQTDSWLVVDLTGFVKANVGKIVSIGIKSNDNDALWFKSRESGRGERIVVN